MDGTLNDAGYITEVIDPMVHYGDHSERATFHVTGIGQTTIILGHMWLVEHNPEIDWSSGKVSMTRCLCQERVSNSTKEQRGRGRTRNNGQADRKCKAL